MAASTFVPLSRKSQASFIEYYKNTQNLQNITRSSMRSRMETIDKQYQREVDSTEEQRRAKAANKAGDPERYQNMVVPVVMPQVEAAVTYQASVFLTGEPLFGVVASPEYMDEALQMESIISEQAIRGAWVKQLMLFFRDGFKYNFAPIEVDWAREVTSAVETNLDISVSEGIPKEVIWKGNRLRRLDPYNVFLDTRVPPSEVHKEGEFVGYTELMSRIKLKKFIAELPDKIISSIKPAYESGIGTTSTGAKNSTSNGYYVPTINSEVDETDYEAGNTNWLAWVGIHDDARKIDYKDSYEVTTLYTRILPAEFELKVPKSNTPQIYKLIIVNHEHIIYCERQTNAHNYLPILIGQPLEDGLSYQTKSLAENGIPFQQLATTYMASILASRRRSVTDRVLYDPSRIASAHINSPNPSAKIPVRPAAYGKPIQESVYAFPYREDQAGFSMQQIQTILGLSNTLAGQNQAQQGQFVKGNKTLSEFESVMQNANGRDQLAAMLIEHQVFTPLKQILKLNILQYQGGTSVYNRDKNIAVEIDPVTLRKSVLNFRISDGLIPSSKIISSDSFATALQVFGSSQQIAGEYNVGQAFSYLMKTQGADLASFQKSQEQLAYEQAMGAWQQLAALAMEKGAKFDQPQPLPEQFGYDPSKNKPAPEEANGQQATPQSKPNPTEQGL